MAEALTLGALLALAGLFVLANAGERHPVARVLTLLTDVLLAGTGLLFATAVAILALFGYTVGRLTPDQLASAEINSLPVVAAGLFSLASLAAPVQRGIARVLPLRPGSPVDYTAWVLALLFIGLQLGTQLSSDVLARLARGPAITATELLAQEIPLLVLAVAGVGLFVRRSWRDTAQRLGLTLPPSRWWWIGAMITIGVFLAVGAGIEAVAGVLTPATQKRVSDVSNVIFRRFDTPAAIVLLGVAAGVAEEVLFRGALQPRFGLIATAFLFAAVHTQYGITFASLEVFVLGVGLGLLRQWSGTLTCVLCHAGYDITVGLIGIYPILQVLTGLTAVTAAAFMVALLAPGGGVRRFLRAA